MKAKELKEKVFDDFIKWLDKNGIGDHFSMDVWMSKVWDQYYNLFAEEMNTTNKVAQIMSKIPFEQLEKGYNVRKEQRAKFKLEEEKAKKNIEKEREKIAKEKNESKNNN